MSISTKTGDKGYTSLWSRERVKKSHIRVESYGTLDELNSNLGEAKHLVKSEEIRKIIIEIQNDLFRVGGMLATIGEYKFPVLEEDVERITNYVYHFEEQVQRKGFFIPGNTIQSAKLDTCRTITRRAERRILSLDESEPVPDLVKQYVNRLSDLIFIMARVEEKNEGKLEYKKW